MKFKQKYDHISDFFDLMDAIRGKNNIFQLVFKCKSCEKNKILKSNSRAPTSYLKAHVAHCHPEILNSFLTLRECNKLSGPGSLFIHKI